jgi:hypothetical protein
MEDRQILLLALGVPNTAVFFFCHIYLRENPGSGPEGISFAFVGLVTVFFSVFLSALTLKISYEELRKGCLTGKTVLLTVLAVAPLLFYLLVDFLPYRR